MDKGLIEQNIVYLFVVWYMCHVADTIISSVSMRYTGHMQG